MTVRGLTGEVQWGYHQACALGSWTVVRSEGNTWSLTATIVRPDTFRLSQRPLVFVAPHKDGAWRWPIVSLQIEGAALTAQLGPKG
jgi:hypothetical protein